MLSNFDKCPHYLRTNMCFVVVVAAVVWYALVQCINAACWSGQFITDSYDQISFPIDKNKIPATLDKHARRNSVFFFFLSYRCPKWWFKAMWRRKLREWKKKTRKTLALRMCQAKAERNVKLLRSLLGNHQWMTVQTNYNYLHRALFRAYFIPSCKSLTCVLAVFFASM